MPAFALGMSTLYDDAENLFKQIISKNNYLPAYNNLGNIYLIQKSYEDALCYFNKANTVYKRLVGLYPDFSDRYAFLAGTVGIGA